MSAIWIVLCMAWIIVTSRLLENNRTFELIGEHNERYEVIAPPTASQNDVLAFVKQNQRTDCTAAKTGPWCDYPAKLTMPRRALPLGILYAAFGFPAALFMLGGGLYWALRGFRKT